FHGKTEVIISSPVQETIRIKVCDLIGNVLQTQTLNMPRSNNSILLSSDELSPGIYLYSITNGKPP
ncbi:MAG: T9SS type A sorting domain-containing protein, partial [Saprospiraceae bacterium]|nr:T9SS type A sorting domain-containing protein [Candidatus Brachybacter algidus]